MKDERAPCQSFGLILDNDENRHSPLLFLLADTLSNNFLDFRIHDLIVAGRLHSLKKGEHLSKSLMTQFHKTKGKTMQGHF